jgi:hypothetical protein
MKIVLTALSYHALLQVFMSRFWMSGWQYKTRTVKCFCLLSLAASQGASLLTHWHALRGKSTAYQPRTGHDCET